MSISRSAASRSASSSAAATRGLFVGLTDEIDGLVHLSDISWDVTGEAALEGFSKGDSVKAKILDVDIDKERISLGIKQLTDDPFAGQMDSHRKGEVVTCTVTTLTDNGIEVSVGDSLTGFIRRADLSRDRAEQRSDRFAVGEKVDAVITNIDRKSRKLSLSIKARETAEEKQAVEEYGSSDSGASLGDILGAALAKRESGDES
jgi:small subunit ribosomal protein S1